MVSRVNTSNSISKALNYNEQKVKEGKAEILSASGFLKEAHELNFYDKSKRFEQLISLNERTTTNSVHISLNFDPSEKISNEKMIEIADAYMQKIGFADQPYLIYRHYDSGHPHIHIVTTNIQRDGKRISMHNLGRNQSETARKEIEKEFNLVKAESKHAEALKIIPVNAQKVRYGKAETKRPIQNVLSVVLTQYKFSSLAELNAVLKEYNIVAETGGINSKMYKGKGLTYRVLDENGNKVGAPVKASAFYMKPTLKWLEKKFEENLVLKVPFKKRTQTSIDWILAKKPRSLDEFIGMLKKEHINVLVHKGKGDMIYGLTYIDHKSKVVLMEVTLVKDIVRRRFSRNFSNRN